MFPNLDSISCIIRYKLSGYSDNNLLLIFNFHWSSHVQDSISFKSFPRTELYR